VGERNQAFAAEEERKERKKVKLFLQKKRERK
jgi:hypothetical protein